MSAKDFDLLDDHPVTVQDYHLHLVDGTVIEASDEYYKPVHQSLIAKFDAASPDSLITVGDRLMGFTYIPKRNILYINTAGVRKVSK